MQGQKRIGVAGATGRVGRHTVDVLESAGHDVVPISRSSGVDIITGEGLAAALQGVDSIIDAAVGGYGAAKLAHEQAATAGPIPAQRCAPRSSTSSWNS
jgi:nucleoside-diphosphate-sugar epimerase